MSLAWRRQLAAIQRSLLHSAGYTPLSATENLAPSGFLAGLSTLPSLLPLAPPSLVLGRRSFAALPQLQPADSDNDHIPSDRLHHWRRSLPSIHEATSLLRRSCGASPAPLGSPTTTTTTTPVASKQQQTQPPEEPQLRWEDIVERARAYHNSRPALDSVLTDTFGRKHTYLRISLTERCNLRCLYCMPEEGVDLTARSELLSASEIQRLTRLFAHAGVNKVRLTGGEPTLRRDLPEIVQSIANVQGIEAVGLTSNGLILGRNLSELRDAGLSLLNISLDTLKADRFEQMTRRRGHARVLETIYEAARLGFDPVKVNVVVMKGVNDDEISDFVELTRDLPINVRFIEYMPFDGNVWSREKLVPYKEMMAAVLKGAARTANNTTTSMFTSQHANSNRSSSLEELIERCEDPAGEVAKNFRLPGHRGMVSFVTSMTSSFCGDCNRLRIMADGNLKVCLFGANEVSLRDAMRGGASDDDLLTVMSAAVDRKKAAHAGMFELARTKNRAMVKIGG